MQTPYARPMVARGVLLDGCARVTAVIGACWGPPPAAAAPEPEGTVRSDVVVLPLSVQGELPPRWHAEAEARLATGLSRGDIGVESLVVPVECRTPACWSEFPQAADAAFVVMADLVVGDARDYAVVVDVVSAKTGKVVASTSGTCELCGFEEAVAMIEARAAVLAPEVARLGAVLPVLLFRSDPPAVQVQLDGRSYGATPVRITAPAGSHTVKASKDGFLPQSFEIDAVDGVSKEVELRLLPRPVQAPEVDERGRAIVWAGAGIAAAGLGGVAAGVSLLVLDGRPYRRRCEADADGTCQFDYETTTGGAVATAVGAVALTSGVALLIAGLKRTRAHRRGVAATPTAVRLGRHGGVVVRF